MKQTHEPTPEMRRLLDLCGDATTVEAALAALGPPDTDVLEGHKPPRGLPEAQVKDADLFRVLRWNGLAPGIEVCGLVDLDGRFQLSFRGTNLLQVKHG